MIFPRAFWSRILAACSFLLACGLAAASTYEAPLPAQLSTDPDLCKYVPCKDVLPGADHFSHRMGKPTYVEAYRTRPGNHEAPKGDHEKDNNKDDDKDDSEDARELVGYVFLSTDIVDIPAYSGKPVVTLIGMDTRGIITGVRILRHSEPILLLGIPEEELTKFILQYLGKFVGDKIDIGKGRPTRG